MIDEYGVETTYPESFVLTWTGLPGKTYTLEHSLDLATWTPLVSVLSDGTPIESGAPITNVPRQFLRVAVTDTHSDSDDLTDWEEYKLGTDPSNPDTDFDGINDKAELEWINPTDGTRPLSPLDPDCDKDGILDGIEIAAGTNPAINNAETSPDEAGLIDPVTGNPTFLLTTAAGRWDLEAIESIAGANVFKDSTTAGRHATPVSMFSADPEGMISKCARTNAIPATGHVHVPATLLDNKTHYTVSFWANIEPGSVLKPLIRHEPQACPRHRRHHLLADGPLSGLQVGAHAAARST